MHAKASAQPVVMIRFILANRGDPHRRPAQWALTINARRSMSPAKFRGAPEAAQGAVFAELQWWMVLEDPVLQGLIRDALANNYDLRIAANRVLQAREQLGITRASQLPSLGGFVEAERQRVPPQLSDQTIYSGGLQLSWVLDFWGQFRRATEAARATLLATEYARNAVRITLIANVASAYFQLRAFDQELDASKRILQTTQQQYFTSELQSSQAWFAELQNYVQLYQALGGGWQH